MVELIAFTCMSCNHSDLINSVFTYQNCPKCGGLFVADDFPKDSKIIAIDQLREGLDDIIGICVDYDGYRETDNLMKLIDELRHLAIDTLKKADNTLSKK